MPNSYNVSHGTPPMDWRSFTEFFEGEGAVSIRPRRTKKSDLLEVCVVIGQKWKPKLEQLDNFLRSKGIDSAKICEQKYGYTLWIFKMSAVVQVLTSMRSFAFLMKEQIRAAWKYLRSQITGDKAIAVFNREYELGKRRSRPPAVSAPLSRRACIELGRAEAFNRIRTLRRHTG